jgi:hypothetical protein
MTDDQAEPERLTDETELLFRQVHPNWLKDGQPSSQAFKPTPKDEGKLSTARGTKTTAEDAFLHHTDKLGLQSAGTWAVTVEEIGANPVPLAAYGDPVTDPVPDPAHAFIEYPDDRKRIETKAKILRAKAGGRGRLHPNGQPPV